MGSRHDGSAKEQLALSAFINLTRAANSLTARQQRRVADDGITLTQFGVLEALYHVGPLAQKQLGDKLLKTSGNMTMVVDNLEKRGLVTRNRRSDDRRYVRIQLTPAGRRLIKRLLPEHLSEIVKEMSILTEEELDTLRNMCRVLGKQRKE